MKKILLFGTLIFLARPAFAQISSIYQGDWQLIGNRCISKTTGKEFEITRELHEKNAVLTLTSKTLTEIWDRDVCKMQYEADIDVLSTSPLKIRVKNSRLQKCEVDGVSFGNSRGVDHFEFTFRREGLNLIEDHWDCHNGEGVWQWIWRPFSVLMF